MKVVFRAMQDFEAYKKIEFRKDGVWLNESVNRKAGEFVKRSSTVVPGGATMYVTLDGYYVDGSGRKFEPFDVEDGEDLQVAWQRREVVLEQRRFIRTLPGNTVDEKMAIMRRGGMTFPAIGKAFGLTGSGAWYAVKRWEAKQEASE